MSQNQTSLCEEKDSLLNNELLDLIEDFGMIPESIKKCLI